MEKGTFISSVSPYPEEEYYLQKNVWSTTVSDWGQRFEVGGVVADPSGSWTPSTAQEYIDSQVALMNTNLTSETIARQTGDVNLQTQLNSEMSTRADQDANLNALINAGIREGGGVQFDTVPTQNSANGITSGGMYSTLRDSNVGFVDNIPTAGSNNLVKSGGVFDSIRHTPKCLFKESDIVSGKYINGSTGAISNGSSDYRLAKFQITEKAVYQIYCPLTGTSAAVLAKYTDSTYATADQVILHRNSAYYESVFLTLNTGYYAICVVDGGYICKDDGQANSSYEHGGLKRLGLTQCQYVTSSGIAPGGTGYFVSRLVLAAGNYEIKLQQGSGSSKLLVKFTDDSYKTVESVIVDATNSNLSYSNILTLEAGYYTLCACKITLDSESTISLKRYYPEGIEENLCNGINSIENKYIDANGIISNASTEYSVSKLYLDAGYYKIDFRSGNTERIYSGMGLTKYTNDTYSTVEKIIIGSAKYSKVLYLSAGYYGITLLKADPGIGIYKLKDRVEYQRHHTNIPEYDLYDHRFISESGSIQRAGYDYKVITKYLLAGYYDIQLPCSNFDTNNGIMFKYTDDTYTTVEKAIVGKSPIPVNETMFLEEGYYGFCVTKDNDYTDVKISKHVYNNDKNKHYGLFDLGERNICVEVPYSSVSYQGDCVFDISNSIKKTALYQAPYVTSVSLNEYKTIKFYLQNSGLYLIVSPGSESGLSLTKYTDSNYSNLDTTIIRNKPTAFANVMYLEQGYYVFGWSYRDGDAIAGDAYITSQIPTTIWSNISNGIFINTSGTTVNTMVTSKVEEYADEFNMSAIIEPLSFDGDNFQCLVGKYEKPYRTSSMVCLGKDSGGSYIALSTVDSDTLQVDNVHKYYISGLDLKVNTKYTVTLEQRVSTYVYHNIKLTTNRGIVYEYNQIESNYQETVGSGWGKIAILPTTGTAKVSNVYYGYPRDINNLKLIIIGHSFVEGQNSTVADLDKRFGALLAEAIGTDKCILKGKGGESTVGVSSYLKTDLEVLKSAKYALFCLGTNDVNNSNVVNTFKYINDITKSYGVTPIWLTITPSRTGETKPLLDAQIRQFENVVDVATIFYNEDGSVNTSLLADNVHPTIEGYRRMYNMIIAQCSYLLD